MNYDGLKLCVMCEICNLKENVVITKWLYLYVSVFNLISIIIDINKFD